MLGDAGFVKLTREAVGSRPRTWVSITPSGRKALRKEVNAKKLRRADNHDDFQVMSAASLRKDDIVFVDGIPHTATGKILKTALRDQFKTYSFPTAAA